MLSSPDMLGEAAVASFKEREQKLKDRLKQALDEKRDFEIEFLQLQKNYLKTKNENKSLKENGSDDIQNQLKAAKADVEKMKKKLNDKIDDVPDADHLAKLQKQIRDLDITHNDELNKKDEDYRVLKGKHETQRIQFEDQIHQSD